MPNEHDHYSDTKNTKSESRSSSPDIIKNSSSDTEPEITSKRSGTDASTSHVNSLKRKSPHAQDISSSGSEQTGSGNETDLPKLITSMFSALLARAETEKRNYQNTGERTAGTKPATETSQELQSPDAAREPIFEPFSGSLFKSLDPASQALLKENPKSFKVLLVISTTKPLERVNYALSLLNENSGDTLRASLTKRKQELTEIKEGKGDHPLARLVDLLETEAKEYKNMLMNANNHINNIDNLINKETLKIQHLNTKIEDIKNGNIDSKYKDKQEAIDEIDNALSLYSKNLTILDNRKEKYNKISDQANKLLKSVNENLLYLYDNEEILWREKTTIFLSEMEQILEDRENNRMGATNLLALVQTGEEATNLVENVLYHMAPVDLTKTGVIHSKDTRQLPNTIATDINTAAITTVPSAEQLMVKRLSEITSSDSAVYDYQQYIYRRKITSIDTSLLNNERKTKSSIVSLAFLRKLTEHINQQHQQDDDITEQQGLLHVTRSHLLDQNRTLLQEYEKLLNDASNQIDILERITTQHELSCKLTEDFISRLKPSDSEQDLMTKSNAYLKILEKFKTANKQQQEYISSIKKSILDKKEEYKRMKQTLEKENQLFLSDGSTTFKDGEAQAYDYMDDPQELERVLESDTYKQLVTNFAELQHVISLESYTSTEPLKKRLLTKSRNPADIAKSKEENTKRQAELTQIRAQKRTEKEEKIYQDVVQPLTRYVENMTTGIVPHRENSQMFESLDPQTKRMITDSWNFISGFLLQTVEQGQQDIQRLIKFDKNASLPPDTTLQEYKRLWKELHEQLTSGDIIYPIRSTQSLIQLCQKYYTEETPTMQERIRSTENSIKNAKERIKTLEHAIGVLQTSIMDEERQRSTSPQTSAGESSLKKSVGVLKKHLDAKRSEINRNQKLLKTYNERFNIICSLNENTNTLLAGTKDTFNDHSLWIANLQDKLKEMDKIIQESGNADLYTINPEGNEIALKKAQKIIRALANMDMRPIDTILASETVQTSLAERIRSTSSFGGEYTEQERYKEWQETTVSPEEHERQIRETYRNTDMFIERQHSIIRQKEEIFYKFQAQRGEKLQELSQLLGIINHLSQDSTNQAHQDPTNQTHVAKKAKATDKKSLKELCDFLRQKTMNAFHSDKDAYINFLHREGTWLQQFLTYRRRSEINIRLITIFSQKIPSINILSEIYPFSTTENLQVQQYHQTRQERLIAQTESLQQKLNQYIQQIHEDAENFEKKAHNDQKSTETARSILESKEYKQITKQLALVDQKKGTNSLEKIKLYEEAFSLLEKHISEQQKT